MKKHAFCFSVCSIFFFACNNATSDKNTDDTVPAETSVTTEKEEPWVAVDSATEMKAWMEYSTPGEMHNMLAASSGTWNCETTMWMNSDAPPMKSTAKMVNKMSLGGRYQLSTYTGNMMGMPFEGMSTVGYDNYEKKFISTWIDNMGTGVMKMEGTWDAATKTISFSGTMVNPANGRECKMREVYTYVDANTEKLEMYGPDSRTGKEYKTMEMVLTRAK